MKISGKDLLPFDEAQAATRYLGPTVNGIRRVSWGNLIAAGENEALLCPYHNYHDPDIYFKSYYIPLRALRPEAIRRLGLHHWPDGVEP